MADKTGSSDVFSSIFGTHTQGLSLFSNDARRRPKHSSSEVGHAEPSTPASKDGTLLRVPGAGKEGRKETKKEEQLEQDFSELLSTHNGNNTHVFCKKHNFVNRDSAADNVPSKAVKLLHHAAVPKKKQQIHSKEPVSELANAESRVKHGKRVYQDGLEQPISTKRQKGRGSDGLDTPISAQGRKSAEGGYERVKTSSKRKKDGGSPDVNPGKKLRKLEDILEARYERKLRGTENIVTLNEDPGSTSEVLEEEKLKGMGKGSITRKRKRLEGDGLVAGATDPQSFDAEEKLKRTIFVGNMPLTVKKKALINEFSIYGPVESIRLRSVPLLDTKIPRRGAIIKGQINEAVNSQHAYVVFGDAASANAALAHNMQEFHGNHLRVDIAYAPQTLKRRCSLQYDPKRSIFVGNIPFDVKDEELYQTFGTGKSPEMDIEAVRVVRDPQTSISKGIAYVLFKTPAGALSFLSTKRKVKLRDRILRIRRVLASQAKNKQSNPSRHPKTVADLGISHSNRKRAKLSASYEGVRATKESVHSGQEKRKGAGSQQHIGRSLKGGSKGSGIAVGSKRKRKEKHQRGISRSKKIRRR
ncbi:hypothetical protein L7F22_055752 [Adiantum nelumboides]|nr:hypothetical protein [Adiantum nelumboides]